MINFMHSDEYKELGVKAYVERNIDMISDYIISLEACTDDNNSEIISLITAKRFMYEFMENMVTKNHIRAFNNLINHYLFMKDKGNARYKSTLINKYFTVNRLYIRDIAARLHVSIKEASNISVYINKVYDNEYSHNMEKRVYRFTSYLYSKITMKTLLNTDIFNRPFCIESLQDIVRYIFKGYEDKFCLYALLEVRDKMAGFDPVQINTWNMVTNYVLDLMENMDSVELKGLITEYISSKSDDLYAERRISLCNHLAADMYPNILKICEIIQEEYPMYSF